MKTKLLFLLTLVAGFAFADVLEVRLWKAIPGNSAQLTQHASEARSIQQKLGGQVVVATDRQGRLHLCDRAQELGRVGSFPGKAPSK